MILQPTRKQVFAPTNLPPPTNPDPKTLKILFRGIQDFYYVKMPFSKPIFFRHRDTIDSSVSEDKTRKLKKRVHFNKERDTASLDLSRIFMGNKASLFDPAPQPPRPRRPATTDLPNLPSLPIYQSFTAKSQPATILDDGAKPPIPEKSPSRRSSISSRIWPLPALTRGRSSERTATPVLRRHYSNSVDTAAPEKRGHSLPRYDRASYLAESYRALLPDMNSAADQQRSWDPREPRPSQQTHPALHHLGNRPLYEPAPHSPETARPWLSAGAGPRPSSAASSSTTAVDQEDHSPVSDAGCRRWSIDTECSQYATEPFSRSHETQPPVHSLSFPNRGPPLARQRTSDDVGLQICSEMLNAELRKSLVNRKDGSKLRFLLLIEAYEATLESCRKEISKPPLTRGGEGEIIRRRHFREAMRILNHWLDCLYTLYDEEFGEVDGVGTRGSMI